jgi:peptidyl-prolyl cis-trans isomerase D
MRIFLIALAIGFAMWGIDDVFRSVGSNDAAVRAGKVEISAVEAAVEFERTRRHFLPGLNNSEAISQGLLNEILSGLARRALFTAEAGRLNLTVTREMEKNHLANQIAFQDETGVFSPLRFNSFLGRAGLDEAGYLSYLQHALKQQQLFDALTIGMTYPGNLAEKIAAWRVEQRIIDYVEIPVDINAAANPVNAEVDTWYNANKDSFSSPDLRRVTALVLSSDELLDDVVVSDEEIRQFYDDNVSLYSVPEQRQLRQMVFSSQEEAQTAVDRVSAGASFASVAEEMLSLSDADTQLGNVTRGELNEDLIAPVFNAEQGSVIGPVSTLFGQNVLIVDKITEGGVSTFENVRSGIENELRREQATDLIYARITEVEDELSGGATLEEIANTIGIALVTIDGMDRSGHDINGEIIDGIAGDTQFRNTVWTSAVGEDGFVEEAGADTFYVLRVDEEIPAAERPLADVRDRVVKQIKTERALEKARLAASRLVDSDDFYTAVNADGLNVATSPSFRRDGVGFDHAAARLIANNIFNIDLNESTLVETGDTTLAITVKEIIPASGDDLDVESDLMSQSLSQNIRRDLEAILANGLSRIHEIDINSAIVQNLLTGSP